MSEDLAVSASRAARAAHGWDWSTVNTCRWAAAMHFGGQHDLYYYMHHTTGKA